jgi:hypothetical protein
MVDYTLPQPTEPLVLPDGSISTRWYNYWRTRVENASVAELLALIQELAAQIEELQGLNPKLTGVDSVSVLGQLLSGATVRLVNDQASPLAAHFYSTDDDLAKGWNPLYPHWVPNPYADYLVDEDWNYLVDENGNFLTAQDGFPIPLEYGGTGGDYSSVAANLVFASPDGLAGAPVFRALEEADIPPVYDPLGSAAAALSAANTYTDDSIAAIPISSGTWIPTLTNTTNLTGSTVGVGQWLRYGDVVNFSIRVSAQATSGSSGTPVATLLGMSMPIAADLTAANQVAGNATIGEAPYVPGQVVADTVNDRFSINWFATSTSNRAVTVTGTYRLA